MDTSYYSKKFCPWFLVFFLWRTRACRCFKSTGPIFFFHPREKVPYLCYYYFFHPREKVGRKTPAPLFRAEIRVSKTRRREAETGLGGRHPITTGPH